VEAAEAEAGARAEGRPPRHLLLERPRPRRGGLRRRHRWAPRPRDPPLLWLPSPRLLRPLPPAIQGTGRADSIYLMLRTGFFSASRYGARGAAGEVGAEEEWRGGGGEHERERQTRAAREGCAAARAAGPARATRGGAKSRAAWRRQGSARAGGEGRRGDGSGCGTWVGYGACGGRRTNEACGGSA